MIETTNLKLKKWQGTDLVTDVLNWYNSNLDSIDENISLPVTMDGATMYDKRANGVMVVAGVINVDAGTGQTSFTFGTPFYNANPAVVLTNIFVNSPEVIWTAVSSLTKVDVYARVAATGSAPTTVTSCYFVAIGRWK